MWTQLKKTSVMTSLKCKLVNSKDKNAIGNGGSVLNTPNNKLKKRKYAASARSPESANNTDEKEKASNEGLTLNKIDPASITEDQRSPSGTATKEEPKKEIAQTVAQMRNQQTKVEPFPIKLYNKIEDNYHLSNKKALLLNMKAYYEAMHEEPFDSLPVTFHVKDGLSDPNWQEFAD